MTTNPETSATVRARPGDMSLSIRAICPPDVATSNWPSISKAGSISRPPFKSKSYLRKWAIHISDTSSCSLSLLDVFDQIIVYPRHVNPKIRLKLEF